MLTNKPASSRVLCYSGSYIAKNSGTSTGIGAQQTIPHGLSNGTPNNVTVISSVKGATVIGVWADATNIYCTVTTGKAYGWTAESF